MPQLVLECTDNVLESNLSELLQDIHNLLTVELPTDLQSCKARIIKHSEYLVGNGHSKNAFVHLAVHVLPGRTPEKLDAIGNAILGVLQRKFQQSLSELNLQITVAIQDLPSVYKKVSH